MNLRLRATQQGPTVHATGGSNFYRDYDEFDPDGTPISLRFPVENVRGFEGISSLVMGESMRVKLPLTNISPRDIGILTAEGRRLIVQFYTHPQQSDVTNADLTLSMNGEQCIDLDRANADPNALWKGHALNIPHLNANSYQDVEGALSTSVQIPPYARVVLQADILLEKQKLMSGHADYKFGSLVDNDISLIQRRKLEVVCEPSCFFREESHIVVVTTLSTTQVQYQTWLKFIEDTLGLKVDTYSVSLYGSLAPDFVITTGIDKKSLGQHFDGKLIIVLDETFNPLDDRVSAMTPSEMLPNGCMEQVSGYTPSTKWLFVNSDPKSVTALLMSHFTAPPNDAETFTGMVGFREAVLGRLTKEQSSGIVQDKMIREDIIVIPGSASGGCSCFAKNNSDVMKKHANTAAQWLRKNDSLRQHVVVWQVSENPGEIGKLVVRRGFCSTMNSAFFVAADQPYKVEAEGLNNSIKFSVAQALPHVYSIEAFCKAMESEDKEMCSYFKDAFITKFLIEIENYLKGRFLNDAGMKKCFLSISGMMDDPLLGTLIKDKASVVFVQQELSDLVGRFYCAANSKDLRPFNPFSSKISLKNSLVQMVNGLEHKWSEVLNKNILTANTAKTEQEVLAYIKSRGKYNSRKDKRWRKSMRWHFSHQSPRYSKSEVAPFIEIDQLHNNKVKRKPGKSGASKKPATRVAVTRVLDMATCTTFSQDAQLRVRMSKMLVKSIESARNRSVLGNLEPDIDLS